MTKGPSPDNVDNSTRNHESRIFEADRSFAAARDDALLHEILILSAINRALIDQLAARGGLDVTALQKTVSDLVTDPNDLERRLRPSELHAPKLAKAIGDVKDGLQLARMAKHQKRKELAAEGKRRLEGK